MENQAFSWVRTQIDGAWRRDPFLLLSYGEREGQWGMKLEEEEEKGLSVQNGRAFI